MINKHYDDWMELELDTNIETMKEDNHTYWYAFEDSIFYVEGGGMERDTGSINNCEVLNLKMEDNKIWHELGETIENPIHMKVDKEQRVLKCQIHSASHLICGLMNKEYHAPTITFFTNEFDAGAEMGFESFDDSIMNELEVKCNEYIKQDLPIEIVYPTAAEALKHVPDEKIEHDELRAAIIGDIDYNMCGCIHIPSLSQIQMIKFLRYEKTTRGYRIYFVCGNQLLKTYGKQNQMTLDCSKQLGIPQFELLDGINKVQNEVKANKNDINNWKNKYIELMSYKIISEYSEENIAYLFEDIDIKTFQTLCSYFVRNYKKGIFFLCHDQDRCHVMISHHKELTFECNTLFKEVSEKYELRGGGNKMMAQGGGAYQDGIYEYLKTLSQQTKGE
ncbi:MAG: DHHA1 domain-containing protein [Erysipelotrichaceae bacterium]